MLTLHWSLYSLLLSCGTHFQKNNYKYKNVPQILNDVLNTAFHGVLFYFFVELILCSSFIYFLVNNHNQM